MSHEAPARNVPLAPLTTLALGGPAEHFWRVEDDEQLRRALSWAASRDLPVHVLGGGSNLVIADEGVPGLVIQVATRGRWEEEREQSVLLTAAAGEPWDDLAADTVERGWSGLECLAGIPGLVGAAPIQNVGAYGQEVGQVIQNVRVWDRRNECVRDLPGADCGFGYRDSRFKREPERWVVLSVSFELNPEARSEVVYAELARALGHLDRPTPRHVRAAVLELRRSKSMVIDPEDPNRRSVGSFFKNPVVDEEQRNDVVARALASGRISSASGLPQWPAASGRIKLAAAWLIEASGIEKGLRRGPVGVSHNHSLALVHHGGGTTSQLLLLAREIRSRVQDHWGITLEPEPTLLGVAL